MPPLLANISFYINKILRVLHFRLNERKQNNGIACLRRDKLRGLLAQLARGKEESPLLFCAEDKRKESLLEDG